MDLILFRLEGRLFGIPSAGLKSVAGVSERGGRPDSGRFVDLRRRLGLNEGKRSGYDLIFEDGGVIRAEKIEGIRTLDLRQAVPPCFADSQDRDIFMGVFIFSGEIGLALDPKGLIRSASGPMKVRSPRNLSARD